MGGVSSASLQPLVYTHVNSRSRCAWAEYQVQVCMDMCIGQSRPVIGALSNLHFLNRIRKHREEIVRALQLAADSSPLCANWPEPPCRSGCLRICTPLGRIRKHRDETVYAR